MVSESLAGYRKLAAEIQSPNLGFLCYLLFKKFFVSFCKGLLKTQNPKLKACPPPCPPCPPCEPFPFWPDARASLLLHQPADGRPGFLPLVF